ncbi:Collagen alpha-1(II) chain-like [Quillaja saponaria]|uniref:Collagen alpha-1(II) chain-like n=1 Tax=Quillaja saponaria TaxID=32244 RepID=A0AAD7QAY9_QUISA|nr:Collagen alpha-1(II) chain-like [Quillaja saponaria]
MGYYTTVIVFTTILLLLGSHQIMAMRPLEGEKEQWLRKHYLNIQSLQRGPVRSSQTNPCTFITGRSRGRCTLSVAANVAHEPPAAVAFPVVNVVEFGIAASIVH